LLILAKKRTMSVMLLDITKIAGLCIVAGAASIPISFGISTNPVIVWLGNALGSLMSALFVFYVAGRITDKKFEKKISKRRAGRKIVTVFTEGDDNKKVQKASLLINKHGLRIFSFFCPIFPGALIGTTAVYILGLDKQIYKFWLTLGIFFASGFYVFGYWLTFV
jgi:hypothetical protein